MTVKARHIEAITVRDGQSDEPMRVTIVSRIFAPEPSAASFRLGALASSLSEAGNAVSVLTVKAPRRGEASLHDASQTYKVHRWSVLRDRTGYVRGYLSYFSFDAPLFFRVIFGKKADVIVVEPPPTTGFITRLAAAMRRTPYVYYAADLWSDGAAQTRAPAWIVRFVKHIELSTMRGAARVLSVSESLTTRLREIGIEHNVVTVGNGVDTRPFESSSASQSLQRTFPPEFIYAGTASEWHGANIFVEALPLVLEALPDAKIRFIGGGSETGKIASFARELGVADAVSIEPLMPPADLAPILRNATAALASIRPGLGNEFTFPTKLYASLMCGTPSIYAGIGPAVQFVRMELEGVPLGVAVDLDASQVAQAMVTAAAAPDDSRHRARVRAWAFEHVSLAAVAVRIGDELRIVAMGSEAKHSVRANGESVK